jgi:hypothetical protein
MKTDQEILNKYKNFREALIAYEMGTNYRHKKTGSYPILRALAEVKVDKFLK